MNKKQGKQNILAAISLFKVNKKSLRTTEFGIAYDITIDSLKSICHQIPSGSIDLEIFPGYIPIMEEYFTALQKILGDSLKLVKFLSVDRNNVTVIFHSGLNLSKSLQDSSASSVPDPKLEKDLALNSEIRTTIQSLHGIAKNKMASLCLVCGKENPNENHIVCASHDHIFSDKYAPFSIDYVLNFIETGEYMSWGAMGTAAYHSSKSSERRKAHQKCFGGFSDDAILVSFYDDTIVKDILINNEYYDRSADRNIEKLIPYLKAMNNIGDIRELCKLPPEWREIMDEFDMKFPNFNELSVFLIGQFSLSSMGDCRTSFPPVLLVGNPGVGKTAAVRWLADKLNVGFNKIDMSALTTPGELIGTSRHWNTASPGQIFNSLHDSSHINRLVFCDELDKVVSNHNGDPYSAFYTLLEAEPASEFGDAFVVSPTINTSYINWIATANETVPIPGAILSRFIEFNIPDPTIDQKRIVVQNIYNRVLSENKWGEKFSQQLLEDVIDNFVDCPTPRIIGRVMLRALGVAAADKRSEITVKDVEAVAKWSIKPGMAFIDTNKIKTVSSTESIDHI